MQIYKLFQRNHLIKCFCQIQETSIYNDLCVFLQKTDLSWFPTVTRPVQLASGSKLSALPQKMDKDYIELILIEDKESKYYKVNGNTDRSTYMNLVIAESGNAEEEDQTYMNVPTRKVCCGNK